MLSWLFLMWVGSFYHKLVGFSCTTCSKTCTSCSEGCSGVACSSCSNTKCSRNCAASCGTGCDFAACASGCAVICTGDGTIGIGIEI